VHTASRAGGADLSELYVTTREEGSGAGASKHAGGLFVARIPGVRGLHAAYAFEG
jgi:sugar lactone lactonase YvrE